MDLKLWAKKGDFDGKFYWLSLKQHLTDTMNIAGQLWEYWLSPGLKDFITRAQNETDPDKAKQLVRFLCAVHDIGKATPSFQTMKGYDNSPDLDAILIETLEQQGFNDISNLRLQSPEKSHHTIAGYVILKSLGVGEDLCSIVSAHHGKPPDSLDLFDEQKSYTANYYQVENRDSCVYKLWQDAHKKILDWALEQTGFLNVENLPSVSRPAQVILSGIIIMADWISSNTYYFPLLPLEEDYELDETNRMASGWTKWYKTEVWAPACNLGPAELYEERFKFSPREFQKKLIEIIEPTVNPGIFIVEAPMGHGKTEAALAATERLAHKTGKSGMFFGLPTQATSNGIFPRIKDWVEELVDEFGNSLPIRLIHGKSALNEEFTSLPLSSQVSLDDGFEASVVVNEWFSGRKTSNLEDFTIGTVDQFLLLALKQKHLALRHLGFSKKVLIFDEFHAYDAYMNQYLLEAIGWMAAYNVPVIILSATLPSATREDLLKAYMQGKGLKWKRNVDKADFDNATLAYPLISYTDGSIIKQFTDFTPDEDKIVKVKNISDENLFELLENLTSTEGVIGIIVNTVKRSQEIARECVNRFGESRVELLHSNFIASHRAKKENELLAQIGKGAVRPKSKIFIGTQVMEQSLDIDFDVLISDLAPMDLLIQRVGRLHRHDIKRPSGFKEPVLYVLGNNDNYEFEPGSSAVYGDYLLAKTKHYLPYQLLIPRDIPRLVQSVYSVLEVESWKKTMGEKFEKMRGDHKSKREDKESKAKTFKINDPYFKNPHATNDTLLEWLQNTHPNESEERAYAQVRDTEETIEVVALKRLGEGYTCFGEMNDLSTKLSEISVCKKIAMQTLNLPRVLSYPGVIEKTIDELEKYNKKYLTNWQNQVWLKGLLGIIFDQENNFYIDKYCLHYDEKYGLSLFNNNQQGEFYEKV